MTGHIPDGVSFLDALHGYVTPKAAGSRVPSYDRAVRLATVDGAYASGLPRVLFDGEDTMGQRTYAFLNGAPAAGSRVALIPVGSSFVIAGQIAGDTGWSTTAFVEASGWDINEQVTRISGGVVDAQLRVTYTGGGITVAADGNVTNSTIGTLEDGYRPKLVGALSSAGLGRVGAFSVSNLGVLDLAATSSGANVATGTSWTLQGVWLRA